MSTAGGQAATQPIPHVIIEASTTPSTAWHATEQAPCDVEPTIEGLAMSSSSSLRQVDEDYLRQMFKTATESHFKYAPKASREAIAQYSEAAIRKDIGALAEPARQATAAANQSLTELCAALTDVHPAGALELLYGERPDRLTSYQLPKGAEQYSLSRGAWVIGVFGSGDDRSQYGALRAFNKYVRWTAAHLIKLHIADLAEDDEQEQSARRPISRLEINRLVEPETRMFWITDEIVDCIGKWVDENLGRVSPRLGSHSMQRINTNARKARLDARSGPSEPFSSTVLDGLPRELIGALTAPTQAPIAPNVERALLGDAPTIHPFVEVDGETRLLGRSAWLNLRDDALFRLVMTECPRDHEGRPLEDVTATLLDRWGPAGVKWRSSVDLLKPGTVKSGDDLDVFALTGNFSFIGECKANRLSENNASIGANFETKVLNKAVEQLEVRLAHWRQGWRPAEIAAAGNQDPTGFVVTFSSYGGMVWQSDALRSNSSPVQLSVIPLHSLVLAAAIMESPQDLRDYLAKRVDLISRGVTNADELEYLLAFMAATSDPLETLPEGTVMHFKQYEFDSEGMWIDPRNYAEPQDWKGRFAADLWEHTSEVSPAM